MKVKKPAKTKARKRGNFFKKKNKKLEKKKDPNQNLSKSGKSVNTEVRKTILNEAAKKRGRPMKNSVKILTTSSKTEKELDSKQNSLIMGIKSYPMVKLEKISPDWINQPLHLSPKDILDSISRKKITADLNSSSTKRNAKRKLKDSTFNRISSDLVKIPKPTIAESIESISDKSSCKLKSDSNLDENCCNMDKESDSKFNKTPSNTAAMSNFGKKSNSNLNKNPDLKTSDSNLDLDKETELNLSKKFDSNLYKKSYSNMDKRSNLISDSKKAYSSTKSYYNLDKKPDSFNLNQKFNSNVQTKSNSDLNKNPDSKLHKSTDLNTKSYSNVDKKSDSSLHKKKTLSKLDQKPDTVLHKNSVSDEKVDSTTKSDIKPEASFDFDKKSTSKRSRRPKIVSNNKQVNEKRTSSNENPINNLNKINGFNLDKTTATNLNDKQTISSLDSPKKSKELPKSFWNTIENYSEAEFQVNFRLSKSTANYIINIYKRMPDRSGYSLNSKEEIFIFLFYMGNTMTYTQLDKIFDLPDGKSWQTVLRVSSWLLKEQNTYIKWPQKQNIENVSKVIEKIIRIPDVIGVIDTINIRFPYYKLNTSFTAHTIVDGELKFNYVYINPLSSVEKTDFCSDSEFFKKVSKNEEDMFPNNTFIIGNKGYPLETWLIPPFDEDQELTQSQIKLNSNIQLAHRLISKKAFDLLSSRFRRLVHLPKNSSFTVIKNLIISAFILHNICITQNECKVFIPLS